MEFKKENLSPVEITKELQEAISGLPESESWQDYFEGGAGRTIIELIAGSQAIKNHYNLMRVRESSLQYAKLDSSITQLAINKGVYRPPAKAFIGEMTFSALRNGSINVGDILGSYKNHSIYAYETKSYLLGSGNKIKFTVGDKITYSKTFDTSTEFIIEEIETTGQYISDVFQNLSINNTKIYLIDTTLKLYDSNLPYSCLRIVSDNLVKLIFGDGILGQKINKNDVLEYNYMTFDTSMIGDVFSLNSANFSTFVDIASLDNVDVIRNATGYLNKETLRRVAIRNSVDGRWVQTKDYEDGLLREYGEYFFDVVVLDEYPVEKVKILPYIMPTQAFKDEITTLIDNNRGNAVQVDIAYIDPNNSRNYLDISFSFDYKGSETDSEIETIINSLKGRLEKKLRDITYTLTSTDIAVELTNLSTGGKFYAQSEQSQEVQVLKFINTLTITYSRI